jgi:hypothetical protein
MPCYFFNTYGRRSVLDREGVELSGIDEARLIAIRHAGEIFHDEAGTLVLEDDWRLEVLNEAGENVFEFQVHLHTPATDTAGQN